jgi:hypothetical protein
MKARLSFVAPPMVPIIRKEVWDVSGPRGPGWHFPQAVPEPSSN